MKRLFLSLCVVSFTCLISAQEVNSGPRPHPTAEQKALKQTEMIVRELHIDDTVQYHQLYDMHLRYARQYENGYTRAQWLEQMEAMNKDLQTILTEEQYDAFMNKQMQEGPHGQRPQVGRFGTRPEHMARPGAKPDGPEPQPQPLPADLP